MSSDFIMFLYFDIVMSLYLTLLKMLKYITRSNFIANVTKEQKRKSFHEMEYNID